MGRLQGIARQRSGTVTLASFTGSYALLFAAQFLTEANANCTEPKEAVSCVRALFEP